jgi:tRNA nucleotidyltransferase (CCA-adding enzyme)
MSKLIVGKGVFYILNTYKDLIVHVFPEMYLTIGFEQNNPYHIYDVYVHTLYGLDFLKQFNNPTLSFAHLFHDVAKPLCHTSKWNADSKLVDHFYDHEYHGAKVTQKICHRLKFSSDDTKKIYFLVANHRRLTSASSDKAMRKLIQECAEAGSKSWIWDLYKTLEADKEGQAPSDFDLRLVASHIKECLEIFDKQKIESPMSGNVIKDIFKIKDGPNIGKIKDYLVSKVIEGTLDPKKAEDVWSTTVEFILVNNLH